MSIFKRTLDLTTAIEAISPRTIPVSGATGLQFLEVPVPTYVRFDDQGDRIPVSSGQEIQFGSYRVSNIHVDTDGLGGMGELVVVIFTACETMGAATDFDSGEWRDRGSLVVASGGLRVAQTGVAYTPFAGIAAAAGATISNERQDSVDETDGYHIILPVNAATDGRVGQQIIHTVAPIYTLFAPHTRPTDVSRMGEYRARTHVIVDTSGLTGAAGVSFGLGKVGMASVLAGFCFGGLSFQYNRVARVTNPTAHLTNWLAVVQSYGTLNNVDGTIGVPSDTGVAVTGHHELEIRVAGLPDGRRRAQWLIDGQVVAEQFGPFASTFVRATIPTTNINGIGFGAWKEVAADTMRVDMATDGIFFEWRPLQ